MTNHIQPVMTPQRENSIAKVLQSVGRRYVQYFNFTHKRTGTLRGLQGDVDRHKRYLLTCYRYI